MKRIIIMASAVLHCVSYAYSAQLPPDFFDLLPALQPITPRTLLPHSLLEQSLHQFESTLDSFQSPLIKQHLVDECEVLREMVATISRYIDSRVASLPANFEAAWRHLLTFSLSDYPMTKGADDELAQAIIHVLHAVGDVSTALTKAVNACVNLLQKVRVYIGLPETRAQALFYQSDRHAVYDQTRIGGSSLGDALAQLDLLSDIRHVDMEISRSSHWKRWVIGSIVLGTVGAGCYWAYKKYHKKVGSPEEPL